MKLLDDLKIKTNNIDLYLTSLTHTSYSNENNCESYERLEYLGDAVLELVISDYIYKNTMDSEGVMTKKRARYVREDANYEYALKLGLNHYIRLGHGEQGSGGQYKKAILADVFESFIGALYLDKGFDYVYNFIDTHIIPLIINNSIDFDVDYKSLLQELIQTDKRTLDYVVIEETGPAHSKQFTVIAKIDEIIYGKGTAHSKKLAEQLAAKDALGKTNIVK